MRLALIGFVTIAAVAADVRSGSAQESFFNSRYCTASPPGGPELNCAFRTWQQCIETARGSGRYCTENPWWHGPCGQPNDARQDTPAQSLGRLGGRFRGDRTPRLSPLGYGQSPSRLSKRRVYLVRLRSWPPRNSDESPMWLVP